MEKILLYNCRFVYIFQENFHGIDRNGRMIRNNDILA
jgi:hypothetical protein